MSKHLYDDGRLAGIEPAVQREQARVAPQTALDQPRGVGFFSLLKARNKIITRYKKNVAML